jgi:endonuclease III
MFLIANYMELRKIKLQELEMILEEMEKIAVQLNAPVFELEADSADDPFKILVYTMLSARTKDTTTIRVAKNLFLKFPNAKEIANAEVEELEKILYGVGFYRTKAKNLKNLSLQVLENGIPKTIEEMTKLSGVGRKTGNITLARIYGKSVVGVDVHVHRIANRIGWIKTKKPFESETQLSQIVEERYLSKINRIFVAYGQVKCKAKNPECETCPINKICKKIGV